MSRQLSKNISNFNDLDQSDKDYSNTLSDTDDLDDKMWKKPCKRCKWRDEETGRMIDTCKFFLQFMFIIKLFFIKFLC